jgi:uncharacterized protein YndB with AHSA1/START domain
MEKMNFAITINAPKEKVWNALWKEESYRNWTSAFSASSYAVTDEWKQGSKVLFLDDSGSGMVSRVEENRPFEYMSFKHLGEVKNGVEDTTSAHVQVWNGAMENYTLTTTENGTLLSVELSGNLPEEFKEFFLSAWPKALDKLKELAEAM